METEQIVGTERAGTVWECWGRNAGKKKRKEKEIVNKVYRKTKETCNC